MSFLSRCADRLASAFVTETVTEDGTRLLVSLDPSLHGLDVVVVVDASELRSDVADTSWGIRTFAPGQGVEPGVR